jgi:hypothetical protein
MLNLTKEQDNPFMNHLFRIQYVDNTYQLVNWTNDQLHTVYKDIEAGKKATLMDKCIFKLDDIRAIVFLPPVLEKEETEEGEEKEDMVITEMGAYEKELYDLLQVNGIPLGKVIGERGNDK